MPQLQLPIFPPGLTRLTEDLSFQRSDGQVVYFHGLLPVFQHDEKDLKSFRMITSQWIVRGTVRTTDAVQAFGVPLATVKRYLKVYRQHGMEGFFRQPRRRGAVVLTAEVQRQAQALLDEGKSVPEVARQLKLLANTLHKAIRAGRLHAPQKSSHKTENPSSKSERSAADSQAPMGYGTTRSLERVAAALGALPAAPIVFERAQDVPQGGVLLALPALLQIGLLRHSLELYQLPAGFYSLVSVFLVLALMALARIASLEQLRYVAPGEWGNLLGLDRIPEVRTLREKIKGLCTELGRAARWNAALAKEWIAEHEQQQQGLAFYVDGHVRVYHGEQTKLPRHYVARQRLTLRATVDYWVNALDGQPFLYVNKEVDHGLVQALREDVLPWLQANVPVSAEQQARLEADPQAPRFTVIFDREGYSPELFVKLQKERIAALTYHRYPEGDWPVEEFQEREVKLVNGETVRMKLAERRVWVGQRAARLEVREVRKLSEGNRQISMVSTNFTGDGASQAAALMARWSQENFFKYMREHYGLDALVEYGTEAIPDTVTTVNPAWRERNGAVRRQHAELKRCRGLLESVSLDQPLSETVVRQYEQHQGQLQERLEQMEQRLKELQKERKATPRQIPVKDLPEKDRFTRLRTERKHFLDTIKMIAYRAETSMVATVREKLSRSDDARALLRQIYHTEVDLTPDLEAKTLTVCLHHLTQAVHDEAVQYLCEELTATETIFPGTDLRLVYKLGSTQIP